MQAIIDTRPIIQHEVMATMLLIDEGNCEDNDAYDDGDEHNNNDDDDDNDDDNDDNDNDDDDDDDNDDNDDDDDDDETFKKKYNHGYLNTLLSLVHLQARKT